MMKNKNILTIIGMIMLVLAIPSGLWPYGYYQVLRIAITILACYLGFWAYEKEQQTWAIIMGSIAILFNPILPIYLDKSVWVYCDFVVAIMLFTSLFNLKNK